MPVYPTPAPINPDVPAPFPYQVPVVANSGGPAWVRRPSLQVHPQPQPVAPGPTNITINQPPAMIIQQAQPIRHSKKS